jgi:glycine reductase
MAEATEKMVGLAVRLVRKEKIGKPSDEGYFPRGILRNETLEKTGADRAVSMMLDKLAGRAFKSEVRLPDLNKFRVGPAPPIREMNSASIALVTDGGLVPRGNPDQIESSAATRFGTYSIKGVAFLDPEGFEVVHVGYDSRLVGEDPHRLVPLDIMRELEEAGIIGKSFDMFYSTVGVATSSANSIKMGAAIAEKLKREGVSGAILTST